jgi:iron-sulfur cluster assembly protein
MITITPQAAKQIKQSAEESESQGMFLRIAAKREDNGSIEYGLGFDHERAGDTHVVTAGINVVIGKTSKELLNGAILDFVELSPEDHQFIFTNPNDPTHAQLDT